MTTFVVLKRVLITILFMQGLHTITITHSVTLNDFGQPDTENIIHHCQIISIILASQCFLEHFLILRVNVLEISS